MSCDFTPYFQKYEQLVAEADRIFASMQAQHPDCVTCKQGCSDCCHALFDLSLIEALYLNHRFHETLPAEIKEQILVKADQADRAAYKLKFQAYKNHRDGAPTEAILESMARQRVRCPLLNAQEQCDLYAYRPLTCRLYGIPMTIEGKARTCSLSKFKPGLSYPSVDMEKIHQKLAGLSMELTAGLNTKYAKMWDVLVPPSMALLTVYDEEYLGIQQQTGADQSGCASGGCDSGGCSSGNCVGGGCECHN
ncbi:MAG TPA: YkgJ family cysteine cluster protein [Desulfonatronum sp.]|nr:YkgJ family cysteine cluster protein [Desulfonatronum sp.]